MASAAPGTMISLMLAVPDTPAAVAWYQKALGARILWRMGSVAGLELDGAPFFLGGDIRDHPVPWGNHRQGGFTDPFGHRWLVGDKSPLNPFHG